MADVAWGESLGGVRFGLRPPPGEVEAGGTIRVELLCQNQGPEPVWVFGFTPGYPRSLRVSPPKSHRPWIRVSFGDVKVLHPPDAFTRLLPGGTVSTELDLSFAFDRRGAGRWSLAFAYDPVRASGRLTPFTPGEGREALTGQIDLLVTNARSLDEAGIDPARADELDLALLQDTPELLGQLRAHGAGGAIFAARRVARVLSGGMESMVGWNALRAILRMGDEGFGALLAARAEIPHADEVYAYALDWFRHQRGESPSPEHLPFVTELDQIIAQPDRRGNFLISWTGVDSPIHGTRRVEILGRGERLTILRRPEEASATTNRGALPAAQVTSIALALRDAMVWLLRPLRQHGLPDEPRPSLEVQLALGEPYQRRIAMWNGEWRQGPAGPLAGLLDRMCTASDGSLMPPPF
ncbi:MAG: hypothetical protein CMN30_20145 [Sandaracinus sp.]|nr:hypothetical protein [Sandaracinus sp.]